MAHSHRLGSVLWLLVVAAMVSPSRAENLDPLRLLPDSSVFCLTIEQPAPLVEVASNADYWEKLAALESVSKALQSDPFRKLQQVVGLVELRLGKTWQQALPDLVSGGMWLAVDGETSATIVMIRPGEPKLLNSLHDALKTLIELEAANRGAKSPVVSKEYKGVEAWSFGPGECHALVDGLFVLSNKKEALQAVLDRRADAGAGGLAAKPSFQEARRQCQPGAAAWSYLDLAAVRQLPQVKSALAGPSANPLAEILWGGIVDVASRAPQAMASLHIDGNELRLAASLPFDAAQVTTPHRWYFAGENDRRAAPLLRPRNALASLSVLRDLSRMWTARDELFDEKVNAGFTQADTGLGLFFSGRDFGTEVLGELAPQWQFIVARREFLAGEPVPALKLPAMALALEVKDEAFIDQLRLAYQNVIGIINLQGIQSGRPQLLIADRDHQGVPITTAGYLLPRDVPKEKARIEYNFRPSYARVGPHFVIGTTSELVAELVDLLKNPKSTQASINVLLELNGTRIAEAFADNRDLLVSRSLLTSGKPKEEVVRQVDELLGLASHLSEGSLRLIPTRDNLKLEAVIKFEQP